MAKMGKNHPLFTPTLSITLINVKNRGKNQFIHIFLKIFGFFLFLLYIYI